MVLKVRLPDITELRITAVVLFKWLLSVNPEYLRYYSQLLQACNTATTKGLGM